MFLKQQAPVLATFVPKENSLMSPDYRIAKIVPAGSTMMSATTRNATNALLEGSNRMRGKLDVETPPQRSTPMLRNAA